MPRVIGIDPGTVTIDLCGIDDGRLFLDRSLPTHEAVANPAFPGRAEILDRITSVDRPTPLYQLVMEKVAGCGGGGDVAEVVIDKHWASFVKQADTPFD